MNPNPMNIKGPIVLHILIWTTLSLGLIAVMVVFLLN